MTKKLARNKRKTHEKKSIIKFNKFDNEGNSYPFYRRHIAKQTFARRYSDIGEARGVEEEEEMS